MKKVLGVKTNNYFILGVTIICVLVAFKYLSPLVTPFIFAFAFVYLMHPFLNRLQKKLHIKKGMLTAAILLLICITLGIFFWCFAAYLLQEIGNLLSQLNIVEDKFSLFIRQCCNGIETRLGWDSDGIETFIMEKVNVFIENFQVQIVPTIMNETVSYMKNIINIFAFVAITIIAAILLAKDYEAILTKIRSIPELGQAVSISKKIFVHIGTFCKAQIMILLVISTLSAITLFVSGIEGGLVLGLFTGVLDMLPFIGTGIILLPLAFWQVINGAYTQALACIVLYVACVLTREFLEPKLIGEKVGIFPIAILFSVYVGVKLFGLSGVIKGPLALISIYEIYDYFITKKNNLPIDETA